MTKGSDRIAAERERQISVEGYDAAHDRAHEHQLMAAAMCYLTAAAHPHPSDLRRAPLGWPWAEQFWKPEGGRRRNLEKAGALIAATLDSWITTDDANGRSRIGTPSHAHRCPLGHPHPIVRCRCVDCAEWFDQPSKE